MMENATDAECVAIMECARKSLDRRSVPKTVINVPRFIYASNGKNKTRASLLNYGIIRICLSCGVRIRS